MDEPENSLSEPDWRDAIVRIVLVVIVTRLLLIGVAMALELTIPLAYHGPTYSQAPLLRSLTGSDAVYYLGIASEGYHLEPVREGYHDWAFFPLYPIVVRLVSILTLGNIALAGVLAANAAFVAAAVVLYRVALPHLGHETAIKSIVYLSIAPGAVAFAMAYSDSLFLLLAAGSFLAAEWRRWWLVGLLYAAASLSRLPGLAFGVPLAWIIWSSAVPPRWRSMGWLLAGPISVLLFYAYLGSLTGDFLANLHAQSAWVIPALVQPTGDGGSGQAFNPLPLLLVATLNVYTLLLVFMRRDRIPGPHAVLAVITLLVVIGSLRLQSVARYLAVAWPFSWVLAKRGDRFREFWPIVSAGLFVLHAVLHFTQALAP